MKAETAGSKTRKGVHSTHPMGRLVNVTNGIEIRRLRFAQAYILVDSGGWRFCPKHFKLESTEEVPS